MTAPRRTLQLPTHRRPTINLLIFGLCLSGCGERDTTPARARPTAAATATVPGPEQPAPHRKMLAALKRIAARSDREHHYLGSQRVRDGRSQLKEPVAAATWRPALDLAIAELQLGEERAGIDRLLATRAVLAAQPEGIGSPPWIETSFHLGVGYLRLGETENCCARPTATSCILPIDASAVHESTEGSSSAMEVFASVLDHTEPESQIHLSALWLLNLAAMTLGRWPDAVQTEHRLSADLLRSDTPFPKFENIAARVGVDSFSLSGSVVADDFDNDDDIDLLVSSWDTKARLKLFVNDGAGRFDERGVEAGLAGITGGLNMVQADYDNDGHLDVLVLRGAWLFENGKHPNSLLRNRGDGSFTDVTFAVGLGAAHYPTQTAAWTDYDRDGDLDLYVGNEHVRRSPAPCQLFRNDGAAGFVDVAKAAGVQNNRFAKAVAWGDIDGDGLPDLYVSNQGRDNRLFRNSGDGTFVDIAARRGVQGPNISFPAWFWDYDNDGALDLFVASYGSGVHHLAAAAAATDRAIPTFEPAALYHGNGKGRFADVAADVALGEPTLPMGSNFGDLDGDGWLDLYLGTGDVNYYSLMPNTMLLSSENGTRFRDVTMHGGFGHLQKGHGVAFADLDHDGDLDIFEQMGGAYAGDGFVDALYENPGFAGNRWLTVHAVGTDSNRSAIGARIEVRVEDEGGEARTIYRHVGSGGSFGANPLRQTIGLGPARRITAVDIVWPSGSDAGPGVRQRVDPPPELDSALRITEGQPGGGELLNLVPMRLGGGPR